MDKERIPRWGWLMAGLFVATLVANLLNVFVLVPTVFPDSYRAVTVITMMSPVVIYVGIWYDEDRQHYWNHSRARVFGDVVFVVTGATLGAAMTLVVTTGLGLPTFLLDIIAMAGGFLLSWGLFWWRNPELYAGESDR